MDHPQAMRARVATSEGATAVEYALMLVFIAVVIITAVVVMGTQTSATFDCAADELEARADLAC